MKSQAPGFLFLLILLLKSIFFSHDYVGRQRISNHSAFHYHTMRHCYCLWQFEICNFFKFCFCFYFLICSAQETNEALAKYLTSTPRLCALITYTRRVPAYLCAIPPPIMGCRNPLHHLICSVRPTF